MNEVTTFQTGQLPDTIEDLTQFVLVGKAKLDAYMLKLRTVNRLSTAQEIRDQTLKEAQEVSTALIAAEQRIGELLLAIPKASGNQYTSAFSADGEKAKSKSETIKEMGYGKNEASDYQRMAQNPEIVQKVLDDALANGDVVTKSQVMKEIADAKRQVKEENEKLRRALSESEAKRISEKSQTREVIKEVEVVPDDYEQTKADFESFKKDYQRMVNERQKAVDDLHKLENRIRDMESQTGEAKAQFRLEEDSEYFAVRTYDYIKRNGGYLYLFEKINQLPEEKRQNFVKAIYALDAFAKQLIENIGGYKVE